MSVPETDPFGYDIAQAAEPAFCIGDVALGWRP